MINAAATPPTAPPTIGPTDVFEAGCGVDVGDDDVDVANMIEREEIAETSEEGVADRDNTATGGLVA